MQQGSDLIGYVPQHRSVDRGLTCGGRDLVRLGVDGHRWGVALLSRRANGGARQAVDAALAQVQAEKLATVPVGVMSGGELQRVRIAQALSSDPVLLLCDEPLLNLDPANARLVATLIDCRRRSGTAVMFVTHEVNPVLPYVDRILYLVNGPLRIGTVAEVMTSLRRSPSSTQADIQVVQVGDRCRVVGEHLDHLAHPWAQP